MTQTRANPPLQLQLFPMRITESIRPVDLDAAGYNLIVHPGETTQLVAQLHNTGDHPLEVGLRLEGEIPPAWYHIGGLEGGELASGRRLDAVLQFEIPEDFFENHQTLRQDERLVLNYRTYVVVSFRDRETGRQSLETVALNLYLRPHSRYAQYLPVLYREVDLIGRFLSLFEQAFDPSVRALRVMWAHLDPLTAPEALLPFLAHWVGWQLDPRWSPSQQRRLIRNAMEIYRWRGTRQGLRLFLHLYTDLPLDEHLPELEKHICIQEASYKAFTLGNSYLGRDTAVGRGRPYHFHVRLRQNSDRPLDESLIRRIIDQEKPAFSTYDLLIE